MENESTPFELVAAPLPILGTPELTTPTCNGGNDGNVSIDVSYLTETTFFYELRDGATVVQSGNIPDTTTNTIYIGSLASGNYVLYVISAVGDFGTPETIVTANIAINDPDEVVIDSFTPNDISCFGANDGSISVSALGRQYL